MNKTLFSPEEAKEVMGTALRVFEEAHGDVQEGDRKLTLLMLQDARDRISDPKAWIKEDYATTAEGRPSYPEDKNASKWCAVGTMKATMSNMRDREWVKNPGPNYLHMPCIPATSRADFLGKCIWGYTAVEYCNKVGRDMYGELAEYSISDINDHVDTTHAEIMTIFNASILMLESKEI